MFYKLRNSYILFNITHQDDWPVDSHDARLIEGLDEVTVLYTLAVEVLCIIKTATQIQDTTIHTVQSTSLTCFVPLEAQLNTHLEWLHLNVGPAAFCYT
jgi:hypothetical protein